MSVCVPLCVSRPTNVDFLVCHSPPHQSAASRPCINCNGRELCVECKQHWTPHPISKDEGDWKRLYRNTVLVRNAFFVVLLFSVVFLMSSKRFAFFFLES